MTWLKLSGETVRLAGSGRGGGMSRRAWMACTGAALAGCAFQPVEPSATPEAVHTRVLDEWFGWYPERAVAAGLHTFDGRFHVPTDAHLDARTQWAESRLEQLRKLDPAKMTPSVRQDHQLLQGQLREVLWDHRLVQRAVRNPMTYTDAMDVSLYIKRDYAPLDERVVSMNRVLARAPELFAAARRQLNESLPKEFVETALQQAAGAAGFIEKDIAQEVMKGAGASARNEFNRVSKIAVQEFRDFAGWLEKERMPLAKASFAIGRAAYREMLALEGISMTPENVLALGLRELQAENARFVAAAREIDPGAPAAIVYQRIQRDHPTAESLLPDTRRNLEAIRKFVVDRDLVTIPSEVRARVEETLPPFRATSFASMETPGPWETRATEAYYYVTPVEPEWTPERKEEWLSAFNYYTTDVVSIHEAYPGHYVQFLAVNASRASRIAKVLTSYSFAEGWAHYCEEMVVGEGYGQPLPGDTSEESRIRGAKYRLAQSGEALLRLCRLCASVRLHVQGATVPEMTRFFRENCYYEEAPAKSEAMRGTYDPRYCLYSLGKLLLRKLRDDWRAQEGAAFSLKRFHDEVLSHGAPPFRLLREQMLKDRRSWDAVL